MPADAIFESGTMAEGVSITLFSESNVVDIVDAGDSSGMEYVDTSIVKVFVEIEQKTEVGGDGGNDDEVFDHTFYTCSFRFVVYGNQLIRN